LNIEEAKVIIETVLLTSDEPVTAKHLIKVFENNLTEQTLVSMLTDLKNDWNNRGLELVKTSLGWRFHTRSNFAKYIAKLKPDRVSRYSRAVMETLAIVAYRQPVTRGDIELIRGVTVSSQIIKSLEERGWIITIGQREVVGRPMLYGTTDQFLSDLGLRSISELPNIDDIENYAKENNI
jgi:segregation and condensation protein B